MKDNYKQRPIKRDFPSNLTNIIRFNRFDSTLIQENYPKINIIDNEEIITDIFMVNNKYISKSFNIIPNREIEIKMPKIFDFFQSSQITNYEEFVSGLKNEIQMLSQTSLFQNKQNRYGYENNLKIMNKANFFENILKMYTKEGFLYKEINEILRNSHSNEFSKIPFIIIQV